MLRASAGGVFGAAESHRYGCSDPHEAIETCGMVFWDELLVQILGDSSLVGPLLSRVEAAPGLP